MTSGRAIRPPGVRAILLVAALCALVIVAATLVIDSDPDPSQADPGRLTEPTFALPPDTPDAVVSDATEEWGLAARVTTESVDPMAGGLAVADLDRDGDLDLVVAHGSVDILRWENGSYEPLAKTGVDRAMSVTIDDIDRDGWPDLLIARDSDRDLILWGGSWLTDGGTPVDVTELDGAAPSSGLLAGELSGDRQTDILRLGRGRDRGEADILWVARPDEPRGFDPIELPDSRRLSLAAELVDVDGDDLTDIWITRDLGWNSGGDSILSRQGDPTGPWTDVAPELGADLAADSMGVTVADLDGDGGLDAYVSDLGDNEVLVGGPDGFTSRFETGAARIRPAGEVASVISSSWASGAVDLNLDGRLDLVVANGGFPDSDIANKVTGTTVTVADPPALLLGIGDGKYVDVWADTGLTWNSASRGMTIADVDSDGDEDLLFANVDGTVRALRNESIAGSIRVRPDPSCVKTGAVVSVTQGVMSFQKLLAAHTYAGAHQVGAIVGAAAAAAAEPIIVEISGPGITRSQVEFEFGPLDRGDIPISCVPG